MQFFIVEGVLKKPELMNDTLLKEHISYTQSGRHLTNQGTDCPTNIGNQCPIAVRVNPNNHRKQQIPENQKPQICQERI